MTSTITTEQPRQIAAAGFALSPSCLGFGCASLGSRIGARAGLRALDAAFDAGITWYDVAPAYGAGEAETHLARFLEGRRAKVVVTTKVGLAPPRRSAAVALTLTLGRPAARLLSGFRKAVKRTGINRNTRLPLTAVLVERSIEGSLQRLRTDHVDVYALHDPHPDDVVRDDVLRALEKVLARGQARQVAVAGSGEACAAAERFGGVYGVLQTSTAGLRRPLLRATTLPLLVTHSVFGVDGLRDRLLGRFAAEPERLGRLAAAGYEPDARRAASDLLIDAAFAANPRGVVLASMFAPAHLSRNLARAGRLRPEAPALLREALA